MVDKEKFLDAYKISPESGKLFMYDTYFNDSGKEAERYTKRSWAINYIIAKCNRTAPSVSFRATSCWTNGVMAACCPGSINEIMNADYPYVLTDGITIYYASDGITDGRI